MKLKYYEKLEFPKFENQKNDKFLQYIFQQIVLL